MTKLKAAARDWRQQIGAGGRYVGVAEDGLLFWVETATVADQLIGMCSGAIAGAHPVEEVRNRLIGRVSREAYAAAANANWPVDAGALEPIVASVPGWCVRDGELAFAPGEGSDMTVPAASDEVMLLTRNRLLGLWACVTKRSFADVTFPASSPPSRTRWNDDRVLVTCESDSARPVHAELTVDAVNRPRREVTTKVLARVTVERALPRLPADG